MAYATDTDLTTRYPETAAVSSALRTIALADAEAWIDEVQYTGHAVRAHCLVACHLLAGDGLIVSGDAGAVSSRSAGEISVTYATASPDAKDAYLARTRYGRAFLEIRDQVPHGPLAI